MEVLPMHTVFQNDNFSVLGKSSRSMHSSPAGRLQESAEISNEEILEQLSRMLSDDLFMRSERLSRFLRFIVEQTLAGRACDLNQYAVGLAVFDKTPSFDPNIDPIVRVEAGRLRAKLREYHATSGLADPIRIGMTKSGYVPIFKRAGFEAVSFEPTFASQAATRPPVTRPSATGTDPSFGDKKIAIAVLPFANLSRDAASDQFCRELSDRMSKELSRLTSRAVRVVDPITDGGGDGTEIREIGRKYNAEVVLEGSLQTVRKQVRIFSMLARSVDAYGIWADSYDGSFDDLCSPQSNTLRAIAEDVAKALQSEEAKMPVAVA
jgi:TolB-like protein